MTLVGRGGGGGGGRGYQYSETNLLLPKLLSVDFGADAAHATACHDAQGNAHDSCHIIW